MIFSASPDHFWKLASMNLGNVLCEGSFKYVVLDDQCSMKTLVRTKTEKLTDMLKREATGMKVVISGPMYGLSLTGYVTAGIGGPKAPLNPSDTTTKGEVIESGKIVTGISQPERFYFAKIPLPTSKPPFWGYVAGYGDPPSFSSSAIGGVGPLIVRRLALRLRKSLRERSYGSPKRRSRTKVAEPTRSAKQRHL
jgi:hypothetical protein